MKLHLPKCLLAAVLTCFIASATGAYAATESAAYATVAENGLNDDGAYVFYTNAAFTDRGTAMTVIVDTQDTANALALGGEAYDVSELIIKSGLVTTSNHRANGCISGNITIEGGAALEVVGGHDAFGYKGGNNQYTGNVVLKGDSPDSVAQLLLHQNTVNSLTMSTNLTMNGNAQIIGEKGFNSFGGNIEVNGTNNTIDCIDVRENVTLTTNAGSELTVNKFKLSAESADKKLTKAGDGTLTIAGESVLKYVELTGGTFAVEAATNITDSLTIGNEATLSVKEDVTLTLGGTVNMHAAPRHVRDREEGNGVGGTAEIQLTEVKGSLNLSEGLVWQIDGMSATYNAETKTLTSDEEFSNWYYFYNTEGGVNFTDRGSADTVIVDTRDTENALALGNAAHDVSALIIESGLVTTTHNGGNGCISGDITIKGNGIFRVIGQHDAFGYNNNDSTTTSITLGSVSADSLAKLELQQTTNNSVTMRTNIIMNGNAAITGEKGFNTFGCSITVNGTNNSIDCIDLRENVTLTTNANSELTVNKFTLNNAGNKKLTLTGRGTLIINGASELKDVDLAGTDLVVKSDTNLSGTLKTNSGSQNSTITVAKDATLTITTFNNAWGINTLTVDGTLNATASLTMASNTAGSNIISGNGTINATALNVSNNTSNLRFTGGITLNIGSDGITSQDGRNIRLGNMTMGVMENADSWSTTMGTATLELRDVENGTVFAPGEGKTITVSSNMIGIGKLVKSDEGTLILSGDNTYAGGTDVNSGILVANSSGALGTAGTVTVSGGTLQIGAVVDLGDRLTQTGGTISVTGEGSLSVGSATLSGTTSLAEDATVTGNLTIADGGTLQLDRASESGDNAATINGTVTFAEGASLSLTNKVDATSITENSSYVLAWAYEFVNVGNLTVDDVITGTLQEGMRAELTTAELPAVATFALGREADSPAMQQLILNISVVETIDLVTTSVSTAYAADTNTLTIGVNAALDGMSDNLAITVDDITWDTIVAAMGDSFDEEAIVSVRLTGTDNVTLNLADYIGNVSFNGYTGTGEKGQYVVGCIPEPATATLSLLALAALAARRRRKG